LQEYADKIEEIEDENNPPDEENDIEDDKSICYVQTSKICLDELEGKRRRRYGRT